MINATWFIIQRWKQLRRKSKWSNRIIIRLIKKSWWKARDRMVYHRYIITRYSRSQDYRMQVRLWKKVYTLHPYSHQKTKIIWWLSASDRLSPPKKTQTRPHLNLLNACTSMLSTSLAQRPPLSTQMKGLAPKSSSDARCTFSNTHSSSRRTLKSVNHWMKWVNGAWPMMNSVRWLSYKNRWRLAQARLPARRPTSNRCQPHPI